VAGGCFGEESVKNKNYSLLFVTLLELYWLALLLIFETPGPLYPLDFPSG
jgi:hypothetical protein